MLVVAAMLVVIWLVGFSFSVGGSLMHILLLLALGGLAYEILKRRDTVT